MQRREPLKSTVLHPIYLPLTLHRIEAIRKSGGRLNEYAIPEMIDYLKRIGYTPTDLNRLNVVHITGTKGKGSTSAFVERILRSELPEGSKIGMSSGRFNSAREKRAESIARGPSSFLRSSGPLKSPGGLSYIHCGLEHTGGEDFKARRLNLMELSTLPAHLRGIRCNMGNESRALC